MDFVKNSRAIQRIFRTDKYYAVVFLKPSKYFIVNSLAKGSRHGEEVCDYAMPFSASYNFCANSSSGPQSCARRISAEYRSFRLVIAPRSRHVPAYRRCQSSMGYEPYDACLPPSRRSGSPRHSYGGLGEATHISARVPAAGGQISRFCTVSLGSGLIMPSNAADQVSRWF